MEPVELELIVGPALIAVTVLMILLARPKDGISARFLKSWPVGQAYSLLAMSSAVIGVALLISRLPAIPSAH
jgi:hypothetical protein